MDMAWVRHIGYRHLVLVGLTLGVIYVWISVHFSAKPVLHQHDATTASSGLSKKSGNDKASNNPPRADCSLHLPFLDVLDDDASCRMKLPLQSSCETTQKLFAHNPPECDKSGAVKFCEFRDKELTCDLSLCESSIIDIGYLDKTEGVMKWTEKVEADSLKSLKVSVEQVIREGSAAGYLYLRCSGTKDTQLLVLPIDTEKSDTEQSKDHININVIFIDSVSYYHFHRTLPLTVKKLTDIRKSQAKVLSYPLYQSLKSRTYENLQALFSGQADTEKTFSTQAMPYTELKLEALYKPLKKLGYSNLFTEDLCWHWEWGISKDLLVHNKSLSRSEYWSKLWRAFSKAGIDSYGISPSSCEILEANGHPDPFHGMMNVCYNGKYQHHYIFKHLHMYQENHTQRGKPYSSFFSCNVPHDEWGLRVKTLDAELAAHIDQAARQSNTLTILLSDHGNAYGDFPLLDQGREETYHPALFMIAPEKVQQMLGAEIMSNLTANQARLVTVMDIHHLLMYISTPTYLREARDRGGIISPISAERTCSDLPLYQPNICICLDKAEAGLSHTEYSMIAEFSTGFLTNSMISSVGSLTELKCRVLLPTSYSHVQTTIYRDGIYLVTMDLNFKSPKAGSSETIFVSVFYEPSSHGDNKLQLKAFERRTTYNKYWQCGNGGKIESLCICEKDAQYKFNIAQNWLTEKRNSRLIMGKESHKIDNCIYVIQNVIDYKTSSSVYIINICQQASYDVKVTINTPLIVSHSHFPDTGFYIKPLDIQFAFVYKTISIPTNGVKLMKLFSFNLLPS